MSSINIRRLRSAARNAIVDGVKISELPAAVSAGPTDQFEINQGGTSRRVTLALIAAPRLSAPNGTDDTVSLQAAMAANNGQTLVIPEGVYIVTSLAIPSNGITLVGEGPGSTIRQKNGTAAHMMISDGDGALLQLFGLTIDGNQQNNINNNANQFTGVRFRSHGTVTQPARLVIRGCRFINGRSADVALLTEDTTARTYMEVTDCFFLGGCEGGADYAAGYVGVIGPCDMLVSRNTFDFNATPLARGRHGVSGSTAGQSYINTHRVTITDNTFVQTGRADNVTGIGSIDCYSGGSQIVISGNRLVHCYFRGITVKSDQSAVTITSNTIDGMLSTSTGVSAGQITLVTSVRDNVGQGMVCANNVLVNGGQDGINITGSNVANIGNYRNRRIANNVIINPVRRAISVSEDGTTEVTGNSIYGGTTGIYAEAATESLMISGNFIDATNGYAMHLGGNTNAELFVVANQILNPLGRGINVAGAKACTILDNRITVTGNSPLWITGVTGLRYIKNNSYTSDIGVIINDPTNTGPVIADNFIPGTTSWSVQYPDGTITGGDARGPGAVDLQLSRTAPSQVASGTSSVTIGRQNTASGNTAAAIGVFNTASGPTSYAFGNGNTASGTGSMALGVLASDKGRSGYTAFAGGRIAATGDAQIGQTVLRASTTSTAPTTLTSDGAMPSATNIINLGVGNALALDIALVVRDTVTNDVASFQAGVLIHRLSGIATTALVGVPVFTAIHKSAGFAAIAPPTIAADTTLGGLNISVVAPGANATRWVAAVKVTEVQ